MAQAGRTFLVECYLPGVAAADVAAAGERARQAAEELRASGGEIAYLGALFMAADEAVFHQFRASNAAVVVDASRLAGLAFERVVESVDVEAGGGIVGGAARKGSNAPGRENGR